MKYKALATAELVRPMLEPLADRIDFEFAGYAIDHVVMPRDELRRRVADVDVLVCEYDTIDAEIFDAAKNLKIIVCCRGGVKTVIDLDRAMSQKVIVCNNLGRNAAAVSELVMAFLLDLARNVTKTTNLIHGRVITTDVRGKPAEYRDTVWGLDNDSPFIRFRGRSLNHMALGIVGFGSAGRQVAQKAAAFGMEILAYDPYVDPAKVPEGVRLVHLDELLATADAVTLHCVATPQTKGMFNAETFAKMKKGALFVNTSRGELVVEDDLIAALKAGHLAGAAIDVTVKEPIASDSPLLDAPNLLITPHIAGSSDDVQIVGTRMVVEALSDWLAGRKPAHSVVYV
jgi:D-3-phosphoglycerate dehydrogenase